MGEGIIESIGCSTSSASFTAATAMLPVRRLSKTLSREDPYVSPNISAKGRHFPRRVRVVTRVVGFLILLFSVIPLTASMLLLNQELQIVPLAFELVGIGGPGSGDVQLSMRSLLVALVCITGTTWAIGAYLAFMCGTSMNSTRR